MFGHAVVALLALGGCGTLRVSPLPEDAPAADAVPDDAGCTAPGCADLIAYWKLDGDLMDIVGGRPLTLVGNGTKPVSHDRGLALSFDGADGRAIVERNPQLPAGAPDILDNLTSLTFTALINPQSSGLGSLGPILAKGGAGRNAAKRWLINGLMCNGVRLCFELTVNRTGAPGEAGSSTSATMDQWQFVAATFDPLLGAHLYVGGDEAVYSDEPTAGADSISDDIQTSYAIGGWPTPNGNNGVFHGQIDEIQIYRRALTSAEISALYAAQAPPLQAR